MTEPTEPADIAGAIANVGERIDECRVEIRKERTARIDQTRAIADQTAATERQVELLKERHRLAGRALHRTNIFAVVLGFVLLVVIGLYVQQRGYVEQREHDRVAAAVASCQTANATRRALVDYIDAAGAASFDALFAAFASIAPSSPTPEAAARQAVALDHLRSSFAEKREASRPPILGDRDCSAHAVTAPTVPPAAGG